MSTSRITIWAARLARALRTPALLVVFAACGIAARAQEHDHDHGTGSPADSAVVAPGLTMFAIVVTCAIALGVLYWFRRRSMIQQIKRTQASKFRSSG